MSRNSTQCVVCLPAELAPVINRLANECGVTGSEVAEKAIRFLAYLSDQQAAGRRIELFNADGSRVESQ